MGPKTLDDRLQCRAAELLHCGMGSHLREGIHWSSVDYRGPEVRSHAWQ
jgi:hypothetical protein